MASTISNLREIVQRCQSGEPLGENLSRWLGQSLNEFLCRRCASIEDALGLRAGRGGVPWWREEALRHRDAAIRELARMQFADLCPSSQAKRIYALTAHYATSAWRHDKRHEALPPHYSGTPREWLWRAFQSGAPMPIGERQLRQILAR